MNKKQPVNLSLELKDINWLLHLFAISKDEDPRTLDLWREIHRQSYGPYGS